MMLGAVTYNVLKDWDLETVITKLEQAGFEAVELRTAHAHGVEPKLTVPGTRPRRARGSKNRRYACSASAPPASYPQPGSGRPPQEHRGDETLGRPGPRHRRLGRQGPPECPAEGRSAADHHRPHRRGASRGRRLRRRPRVEIWLEVHGSEHLRPARLRRHHARHAPRLRRPACWNSIRRGGQRKHSRRFRTAHGAWIRNVHINELADPRYPGGSCSRCCGVNRYERYTLMEAAESREPERFMRYYRALWLELNRP